MKKNIFCLLISVILMGCSVGQEKLETYLGSPKNFIKDPHFAQYQESLNALESEYLDKKITYVEYLGMKKELDEKYAKEVQEREEIISPNP